MYRQIGVAVPQQQFHLVSAVLNGGLLKEVEEYGETWIAVILNNVTDERLTIIKDRLKTLESFDFVAIPSSNGIERLTRGGLVFHLETSLVVE